MSPLLRPQFSHLSAYAVGRRLLLWYSSTSCQSMLRHPGATCGGRSAERQGRTYRARAEVRRHPACPFPAPGPLSCFSVRLGIILILRRGTRTFFRCYAPRDMIPAKAETARQTTELMHHRGGARFECRPPMLVSAVYTPRLHLESGGFPSEPTGGTHHDGRFKVHWMPIV